MYCGVCNKHIATCTCEDIEERLASIGKSDHVMLAWCKECDRHIDRCICKPEEVIEH